MKVLEFLRLIQVLPKNSAEAASINDIGQRYFRVSTNKKLSPSQYQKMYRWLEALSSADENSGAVVDAIERGKAKHYYLNDSKILEWFMTEQTALGLLLARQVLNAVAGEAEVIGNSNLDHAAENKVGKADRSVRLWNSMRMARHGIGRLPPKIDPSKFNTLLQAVASDRQVRCRYTNSHGVSNEVDVSIHGLVFKDDTIYALAGNSLSGPLFHMAVHRIDSALVLHKPAVIQQGFNLDQYIERDYQLSHMLNRNEVCEPVELVLRVRPDYIYHFEERPLTAEAVHVLEPDGWMRVTAKLPDNFMLKAFIQSMGPGVEVLAPPEIRQRIADQASETASMYATV